MDELVGTGGMSGFIIGITRRHFLTDERTVGHFELLLELTVEKTEERVVVPVIIAVHIINITIINTVHKIGTIFFIFVFCLIVGVEADRTGGINAAHLFHYVRDNAVFFFCTFQVAVVVVELHLIIYRPEEQGWMIAIFLQQPQELVAPHFQ